MADASRVAGVYKSEALGSGCRSILQQRTHTRKASVRESALALNNHHGHGESVVQLAASIKSPCWDGERGKTQNRGGVSRLADRPRARDRGAMRRRALNIPT
ncbi:hypothetical protein PMIN06_004587 [Paraphaeosphaeria minitans]